MATEAMAAAAASTTSSCSVTSVSLGMSNVSATVSSVGHNGTNCKIENKMLPSFSDILWCPDIDGDVMSNPVMGGTILSDSLGHSEESLTDLTDLVGPDIAAMGMVSNPAVAQPVKQITTSNNSTSNSASDMPSDISDLRSSDLLQNLSGVDIDKMFEEVSNIIEYMWNIVSFGI